MLTHVCIWDDKIGYRPISIKEACDKYHKKVSADSGIFVCELCAQNVLLTGPGRNIRHFRHDSQSADKECEDRQKSFDASYGQSQISLSSGTIRLRITVYEKIFSLQLVFYSPPNSECCCDKIIITNGYKEYVYNFKRVELISRNLNVGDIPSENYDIRYINENIALKKYWSSSIRGVNSSGSFFDARTGLMLLPGSRAYVGNSYYLLQKDRLYPQNLKDKEIVAYECAVKRINSSEAWYLYKINVKRFSQASAKFFLQYSIFLTAKPTNFYPIWPPYTKNGHLIYHDAEKFYLYLCGDDAILRSSPESSRGEDTHNGRLYRLNGQARGREQLVSIGQSGALGFAYLIKQPFNKQALPPKVVLSDGMGEELTEETYIKLPKGKFISVLCQYDGKAVVQRKSKTVYVYKLSAGKVLQIGNLSFDTEIFFYQGCDCVRTIRFEQPKQTTDIFLTDEELVTKLMACSGPTTAVSHALGALAAKFIGYPKTKRWLHSVLRQNEISRKALQILKTNLPNKIARDSNE